MERPFRIRVSLLCCFVMAPPVPIHQGSAFYPPPWTEEIDRFFIDTLVDETMNGHYRIGRDNYSALSSVTKKVNDKFGLAFDVHYCFQRLYKLRDRYNVFKWITRLSGVYHDQTTNTVDCSTDAWEFICEKEPLARAYILRGEKAFDAMKLLFQGGPDPPTSVVNVDDPEIIDLTSEGEATNQENTAKGKEAVGSPLGKKHKVGFVVGKECDPDNDWWKEVAEGSPKYDSDDEVSQPSAFSSTEYCKTRETVEVAGKIGRRLFAEDGSSSASFSPVKKA